MGGLCMGPMGPMLFATGLGLEDMTSQEIKPARDRLYFGDAAWQRAMEEGETGDFSEEEHDEDDWFENDEWPGVMRCKIAY
jgi:hypothetical protein